MDKFGIGNDEAKKYSKQLEASLLDLDEMTKKLTNKVEVPVGANPLNSLEETLRQINSKKFSSYSQFAHLSAKNESPQPEQFVQKLFPTSAPEPFTSVVAKTRDEAVKAQENIREAAQRWSAQGGFSTQQPTQPAQASLIQQAAAWAEQPAQPVSPDLSNQTVQPAQTVSQGNDAAMQQNAQLAQTSSSEQQQQTQVEGAQNPPNQAVSQAQQVLQPEQAKQTPQQQTAFQQPALQTPQMQSLMQSEQADFVPNSTQPLSPEAVAATSEALIAEMKGLAAAGATVGSATQTPVSETIQTADENQLQNQPQQETLQPAQIDQAAEIAQQQVQQPMQNPLQEAQNVQEMPQNQQFSQNLPQQEISPEMFAGQQLQNPQVQQQMQVLPESTQFQQPFQQIQPDFATSQPNQLNSDQTAQQLGQQVSQQLEQASQNLTPQSVLAQQQIQPADNSEQSLQPYPPSEELPQTQEAQKDEQPKIAVTGVEFDRKDLRKEHKKNLFATLAKDLGIVVVASILLSFLIKSFLFMPFIIPSGSMENTLQVEDKILTFKLKPAIAKIDRGDIIVFKDTKNWLSTGNDSNTSDNPLTSVAKFIGILPEDDNSYLVKRAIGIAGDHVTCKGSGAPVFVNGQKIDEPYLKEGVQPSTIAFDVTVPANAIFVLGDNRANSADSRYNTKKPGDGFISEKDVVGVAFLTMMPFDRFHRLDDQHKAFEGVPKP